MPKFSNFVSTAMQCSSFAPKISNSFTNVSGDSKSCLNCKNFENNHCKLDLYDEINKSE